MIVLENFPFACCTFDLHLTNSTAIA